MTTTVTSNLNLAKPDIGSEANNWGNVLNGTIDQIDKSIAQRLLKDVGGSSNVTLSDSESAFAIIEFQGTLSGNIDVKTASNDTKPYIIFNNTSGSYTLTFKTNSGTGVAITQGLKSIVYGDGSNIVEATSPANSFSSSKTITLSGIVNGSVSTDFSSNPTITTTIVDGSIVNADVDTSAAIDASKIADGSVSNIEFQHLNGVTTAIQTQINNSLNAANLTGQYAALDGSNINSLNAAALSGVAGSMNGTNINNLNATALATGTVPAARLPGSLGKVLQVVSTNNGTVFSTSSSGYVDVSGQSVTITPSATSSKVLVTLDYTTDTFNDNTVFSVQLVRGSTAIGNAAHGNQMMHMNANEYDTGSFTFLDSPSTTSATTYKLQVRTGNHTGPNGGTVIFNRSQDANTNNFWKSNITVQEIGS